MSPEVVRYSERPELWDSIGGLCDEVWPEYKHTATRPTPVGRRLNGSHSHQPGQPSVDIK